MKNLSRISQWLDKIIGALIVFMIGAMVLVTTAQILARVFCDYFEWLKPLSWSEEVTRYLLIWSTFFGATCVYRHSGNIAITAFQGFFPAGAQKGLRILVHVVCFILFTALLVFGIQYFNKVPSKAASIPVKMKYIYVCIPISMAILMFHSFVMVLEEITGKKEG